MGPLSFQVVFVGTAVSGNRPTVAAGLPVAEGLGLGLALAGADGDGEGLGAGAPVPATNTGSTQ